MTAAFFFFFYSFVAVVVGGGFVAVVFNMYCPSANDFFFVAAFLYSAPSSGIH